MTNGSRDNNNQKVATLQSLTPRLDGTNTSDNNMISYTQEEILYNIQK